VGNSPDIYYLKGLIELYQGNSERAKKVLIDGMKLDPDNKKCREALKNARKCEELKEKGNGYLKDERFTEAL
jgi:DnaJ family protein C protein 7